jgi:hypothetical protein
MFGSQAIDIGLGLVFIYFVLSVICSGVNEMLAGLWRWRAQRLFEGIENLLKGQGIPNLEKNFYNHPLIKSLYRNGEKPSYIPSRTFALTLMDLISPAGAGTSNRISDIRGVIDKMDETSSIRRTFLVLLEEAENDIQELHKGIETWFNDAMDRVSGWYKRRTQLFVVIIATFLVGLSNADTLRIVRTLSHDPALRQELSKKAEDLMKQPGSPASPSMGLKEAVKELEEVQTAGIPLGWTAAPQGREWINKIIGLILSVFATSLGAPFWFDVLNKIVPIRSVGASPEEKEEKALKRKRT